MKNRNNNQQSLSYFKQIKYYLSYIKKEPKIYEYINNW